MVQRIGGFRRKARFKLLKKANQKGKISITRFFQKFNEGDKVVLKAESSYQKGMYYLRFHGRYGIIRGKQGFCYNVEINDQGKAKTLIVHPVHLKKLNQ